MYPFKEARGFTEALENFEANNTKSIDYKLTWKNAQRITWEQAAAYTWEEKGQ